MTATDLLARVAGAGIQLWSENGELRFRAPKGALTPELRAEIGARRAELIALLAEAAAVAAADDRDPLPPFHPELDDEIPLAPGQARWWFLDRLGADPRAALITAALDLRGPLDIDRLARAFADIVRRHQPLRTAILDLQGTPRAVLRPVPTAWPLPVTDAADDAMADAIAREIAARPIDLADGLNLRTALLRQAPDHHRLVVVLHHAAADGWSLGVLLHELQVLYDGGTLPPLRRSYAEVMQDQARIRAADLDLWRRMLADLPPASDLLLPGHPEPTGGDHVIRRRLAPETAARLDALGRGLGVTPFIILTAAAQILIGRLSGSRDFALGTPVANRPDADAEALIGFVTNTLVLRAALGRARTVRELLTAIRGDTRDALAHQSLPFDRLVDALGIARTGTDNPLFRVLVAAGTADLPAPGLGGLDVAILPAPATRTRLDLEIHGHAGPEGFDLAVTFDPARIGRTAATDLLDRLGLILDGMATRSDEAWADLPILTAAEATRIDAAARGAAIRHPRVLDEILARAAEAPTAPALIDAHGSLDRRSLIGRAAALAGQLGAVQGAPVGLMLGRGQAHGIGLLGAWLAGAGAMPLDPELPDARLATMIAIAEPAAIVADAAEIDRLRRLTDRPVLPLPDATAETRPVATSPDDLAYLLFTSGSTGTPKGVRVAWRTLDQLIGWHRARHPMPARTLGFAPLGFDVSMQEAALAWAEGGTLVTADEATRRDPAALAAFISRHDIARLFLPVVMLHALADHLADHPDRTPASVQMIATAGEQLRITAPVRDWCRRQPFAIDNQYGPTETHVVAAELLPASDVDRWPDRPAIGRPVDGATLFVTDPAGHLLPDEVAGELLIGGTAPALGYAGDAARTAERFVTGPDGGRAYRTGDRVLRHRDGRLSYLGRADDQVKIRGFRVEPGEIEAALGSHPDVAQALVVVRTIAGQATLVAHVEPRARPADETGFAQALADHLRARLPEPMVPARWVISPALPRSANGKLDRRALPAVDGMPLAAATAAPPATETERRLAAIWAEILALPVDAVSRGDDFFALGGHSLRATQLIARIGRDLGLEPAVAQVFETPRLADLAAALDALTPAGRTAPIPRRTDDDDLPLSFAQERLWFIDQLSPARGAYNMPAALRLTGRLDHDALARAFAAICRRHAVLRTAMIERDGRPVQRIHPAPETWPLPVEDLSHLADPEAEVVARAVEDAETPFDLTRPLKIRTRLLRLGPTAHVLLATLHHIASDGWSIGVMVRELGALYAAFAAGRPDPLPPLSVDYADVALWQRARLSGAERDRLLDHWRGVLDGFTAPEPVFDRPRPAVQSYQGALTRRPMPAALARHVDETARRHKATPFVVLLAAFQLLIGRISGTADVAVGSPIANRTHPDTEALIGFFVNALVLRSRFNDDPGFAAFTDRVRQVVLDAQDHQDLPFEVLVEALEPDRALDRNPLFQIAFAVQNAELPPLALDGLDIRAVEREVTRTRFDLELHVWPSETGYDLVAYYATDLFDAATIDRLLGRYETLLAAALARPEAPVSTLPVATADEEAALAALRAGPPAAAFRPVTAEIADRAAEAPAAPAILHQGAPLSRTDLDQAATRLARRLIAAGIGPEDRVGLLFDRSPAFVIAALAVLRAGAAYVPMVTDYPDERIRWQIADAGMRAVLAAADQAPRIGDAVPVLVPDDDTGDGDAAARLPDPAGLDPAGLDADRLAYVVYTSGSTGRPKGVAVTHGGLANLVAWHRRVYAPDQTTRMAQVAGLAFDAAGWEIWPALAAGAALVLPQPGASRDPDLLLADFVTHGVTQAFVPTPLAAPLLSRPRPEGLKLDLLLTGGERLATAPEMPGVRLINHYGPTETAVVATAGPVDPAEIADGRAPAIGRPIDGFTAHVLDRRMRPVPLGVAGELWLGGAGLARGYLGRAELTATAFLPDPFSSTPGARLYRTGDLVVRRPDGSLDFRGRADGQVKLRGHRIEPGEIEAALRDDPAVAEAAVLLAPAGDGQAGARLVAFVVADTAADEADRAAREAERAEDWRRLYADTYGALDGDPVFRIAGWTSSYDRSPIPAPEMAAWRDATVAAIDRLGGETVWEIGCGSGLLLWKLAPRRRRYHATDFSAEAIAHLKADLARSGIDHVTLERRAADDMADRPTGPWDNRPAGPWDAIVINSVIQYFPGEDYLLRVLRGALDAIAPDGALFAGDIRAAHVERGFQTSIALHQAPAATPAEALSARIADALAAEKELLIDPAWFLTRAAALPGVAGVDIRLKRGRDRNEMTRFRYDVTLFKGAARAPLVPDRRMVWADGPDFPALCARVAAEGGRIEILDLPNARTAADMAAADRLDGRHATAGDIAAAAAEAARDAVDPETLWSIADEAGVALRITWAEDPALMHVLIEPAAAAEDPRPPLWAPWRSMPARSPINDPLAAGADRRMIRRLRDHLRRRLPEALVPAEIRLADRLPLTPNGKLDRAALLARLTASRAAAPEAAATPAGATEATLARIWCEVLGIPTIGRTDNFFEAGGDSILSIQVASRARKAGLPLAVRDLFAHQTLAELAGALDARAETDAGRDACLPVDGAVPLTPVQAWFLDREPVDPHHFNQAILLTLPAGTGDAAIRAAVQTLAGRHDALRLRFAPDGSGRMMQQAGPVDGATRFDSIDARGDDWGAHAARVQAGLDISRGPLLRVVRYRTGADTDRLLIVAHHLVIDAVSWRLLLDELRELLAGDAVDPVPAPSVTPAPSFTRWAAALADRAARGAFDDEIPHWQAVARAATSAADLPVDDPAAPDLVGRARATHRALDETRTDRLLRAANRALRTEAAEIITAAVARALARLTATAPVTAPATTPVTAPGPVTLLIDREGHGREDLVPGLDPARITGWFTAIHPVALIVDPAEPPRASLARIKDALRAVPRRGAGFGPLIRAGRIDTPPPAPGIAFNYLGQVDAALDGGGLLAAAPEPVGPLQSPAAQRLHALTIGAAVMAGRLRVEITWPGDRIAAARMERLADDVVAELGALVDACMAADAAGLTPSDLPLAGLDQPGLDGLLARLPIPAEAVETAWPATALQHGLLLQGARGPAEGAALYVEQFAFRLRPPVDTGALARAWDLVTARHQALRSLILHEGLERPLVVVARHHSPEIATCNHRALAPAVAEAALDAALARDRATRFDAARACPWRLALHRLPGDAGSDEDVGAGDIVLVWSFHHALLDGWSTFRVLEEVLAAYAALSRGATPDLAPAAPLARFAAWLAARNPLAEETYWRAALDTLPEPQPLPAARPGGTATAERRHVTGRLPAPAAARIIEAARLLKVTPATIAQAAWAMVLARHGDRDDVVFGTTVSGRPEAVAEVERMVGLFINTVAVRVRIDPARRIGDWLAELQESRRAATAFEAAPLGLVQRWALPGEQRRPLFETILAFENYPVAEALKGDAATPPVLDVADTVYEGRTEYPLAVTVLPGDGFAVDIAYDPGLVDAGAADRLLGQMLTALAGLTRDPLARLATVDVLDAAERRLIADWSEGRGAAAIAAGFAGDPAPVADDDRPLHLRLADHGAGEPALIHGDRRLDRAWLDTAARRVAARLVAAGVGKGDLVALLMPRCPELVAAMVGIHLAGAAYLPLDPVYPDARIAAVLGHARPRAVLADVAGLGRLHDLAGAPALRLDVAAVTGTGPLLDPLPQPAADWRDQPAYVIYTSGSTGTPKGVVVTLGNLARLIDATRPWFDFGPGDVWTLFHSPAFDFSVWEIWGPLATGGRLVIVDHDQARDPAGFHRLLAHEGVTVLNQTPSAFAALDAADALAAGVPALDALRLVIFGGEALDAASLAGWFARHGDDRPALVNMYGITETTVHVTHARIRAPHAAETGTAPIGVPIPDLSLQLLDHQGRPVPIGAAGEIHVGGRGLARGYLGRDDLTAERFITTADGTRLYRSGDLGRWRSDGRLDHLGRIDAQVKIRGFRIEPAEIRAALLAHPAIADAAVAARAGGADGELRLVAWILADDVPEDLRDHLKARLPDWMVPSAIMPVAALPLTRNGKLDLAALPDPSPVAGSGGAAPATATEIRLARIWEELLGVPAPGRRDDFFALGGHSLLLARLAHRIAREFGVTLDWPTLFAATSLEAQAARIEGLAGSDGLPPLRPVPRDGRPLPLSAAQRRMLFLNEAAPGPAHTIPLLLGLTGPLDLARLQAAIDGLIARHEALRSRFPTVAGQPVQLVAPAAPQPLAVVEPEDAAEWIRAELARPFDLANEPAFRCTLLRRGRQDHVLVACLHHVAGDGWSVGLLARDLGALYQGDTDLPPVVIGSADLGAAEADPRRMAAVNAALDRRAAALAGLPVLDLPTDRPRPDIRRGLGACHGFTLPATLAEAARSLAAARGTTTAVVLAAAQAALLGGLAQADRFAIGLPAAERLAPETAETVGLLVETLVLAVDLGQVSGAGLIDRLAAEMRTALGARPLPLDRLIDRLAPPRDPARTPVFQTMFGHERLAAHGLDMGPDLAAELLPAPMAGARTDLTLILTDRADGGLDGLIEYDTDLFEAATIDRLATGYARLLAALIAAPDRPVAQLPLGDPAPAAPASAPRPAGPAAAFRAVVAARPQAIAISHADGTRIGYADLLDRADRLARGLTARGLRPGAHVGLYAERSVESIVATLAIMLAGAAYVPIDPAYPAERQAIIARDGGLEALILPRTAPLPDWAAGLGQIVRIDRDGGGDQHGTPAPAPDGPVSPEAVAYLMFTSGSTGRPKPIAVPWRAVMARAIAGGYAAIGPETVIPHISNPSFDAATFEIWGALLNGTRLHLVDQPVLADPARLADELTQAGATLVFLTTALFNRIAERAPQAFAGIGRVLTGGEAMQMRWIRAAAAACPATRFANIYGPTETTTFATVFDIDDVAIDAAPIGRPIADTTAQILDRHLRPLPDGVPGELCLGGAGLAHGYPGDPVRTALAFVPDPFATTPGARLYRTGDRVVRDARGRLRYLGRRDGQIKLRGHRIEPGEIAAAAQTVPGVAQAHAMLRRDDDTPRLVLYATGTATPAALATALRGLLPRWMVPSAVLVLDSLPVTANGKIDTARLPAPPAVAADPVAATGDGTVDRLAAIWAVLLGHRTFGPADNFFDVGGHSLLLVDLRARIAEGLGVTLAMTDFFAAPTLADLARRIDEGATPAAPARPGAAADRLDGRSRLAARRRRP
ncbi:amino acid adenylation domain-containing protein [Tistrella mobilis]|uniref:amino acid adenylation domain-containing protein n=1 Tax=Tistrella mobilis TaxID=171437 RepID=UPI0031F61CB9